MPQDQKPEVPTPAGGRTISIPSQGLAVLIRGLTATKTSFTERELLIPLDEHMATILVRPVLDPGSPVKIVFSDTVTEEVKVWSISQARQASKWRIWVRFNCKIKIADTNPGAIEPTQT
jgi:hypothetical protein